MCLNQQLAMAIGMAVSASALAAPQYVIAISVDGMGSQYAQPILNDLTALKQMSTQGAGTFNARTDAGVAVTLPSHTGMITGRPMNDYTTPSISGHAWTTNVDPLPGVTIHTNRGSYVPSVFDVVHDNGGSTGMWAGKSKFSLFSTSYNSTNGAPDTTGVDNGRNKLDYVYINSGAPAATVTSDLLSHMNSTPYNFSFVHFQDPDAAGHTYGWGSPQYLDSLRSVDAQISNILADITASPTLNGRTVVMLTADHGGHGFTHGDITALSDTTIPFFVWGAGVAAGDIYTMNGGSLLDPGTSIPGYTGQQPMRNIDVANLSLEMLGLGPVSLAGVPQTIAVPEPASLGLLVLTPLIITRRRAA